MIFSDTTRSCGDCKACCDGWAGYGAAYGRTFYPGKSCYFLGDKGCSIYELRPKEPCKRYKCAWLKNIDNAYPEWLQPNLSGVIISNKVDKFGKPYLKVLETGNKIKDEVLQWLTSYQLETKKNMSIQINGEWKHFGDHDFADADLE
jgi:hypothetical protein